MRTIKYKVPIKNAGKSKCYKCKEDFEENEIVLEVDYANHKLCNFHAKELLESKISEYTMLLNEIKN